jgi:hypothetical protein
MAGKDDCPPSYGLPLGIEAFKKYLRHHSLLTNEELEEYLRDDPLTKEELEEYLTHHPLTIEAFEKYLRDHPLTKKAREAYLRGPSIEAQQKWKSFTPSIWKRKRAAPGAGLAQLARAQLFPNGKVPDQIALLNGDLIKLVREELKKMGILRAPSPGHRGRTISDSSILRAFDRKKEFVRKR